MSDSTEQADMTEQTITRPLWAMVIAPPVAQKSKFADAAGRHQFAIIWPTIAGPVVTPVNKPKLAIQDFINMLNSPVAIHSAPAEDTEEESKIVT